MIGVCALEFRTRKQKRSDRTEQRNLPDPIHPSNPEIVEMLHRNFGMLSDSFLPPKSNTGMSQHVQAFRLSAAEKSYRKRIVAHLDRTDFPIDEQIANEMKRYGIFYGTCSSCKYVIIATRIDIGKCIVYLLPSSGLTDLKNMCLDVYKKIHRADINKSHMAYVRGYNSDHKIFCLMENRDFTESFFATKKPNILMWLRSVKIDIALLVILVVLTPFTTLDPLKSLFGNIVTASVVLAFTLIVKFLFAYMRDIQWWPSRIE